MPIPISSLDSCQRQFHQRWRHLCDPRVRALAWLLDSPDLLDPAAPVWNGQVASIESPLSPATVDWLAQLDQSPAELHAYLAIQPFTRLGRYAERLMAFYFEAHHILKAHGVQVRTAKHATIGEFDFLLQQGDSLLHWEFATKLYLLEPSGAGQAADYFVGPNLSDTLGAKMQKIFTQQLRLAQHPDAQRYLPHPVAQSQALIKGWLFYHDDTRYAVEVLGVSAKHCRGFWCELDELSQLELECAIILPRLSWLAPVSVPMDQAVDKASLQSTLETHFSCDSMPVLVAILENRNGSGVEVARGFIVPNDWRTRAGERVRRLSVTGK